MEFKNKQLKINGNIIKTTSFKKIYIKSNYIIMYVLEYIPEHQLYCIFKYNKSIRKRYVNYIKDKNDLIHKELNHNSDRLLSQTISQSLKFIKNEVRPGIIDNFKYLYYFIKRYEVVLPYQLNECLTPNYEYIHFHNGDFCLKYLDILKRKFNNYVFETLFYQNFKKISDKDTIVFLSNNISLLKVVKQYSIFVDNPKPGLEYENLIKYNIIKKQFLNCFFIYLKEIDLQFCNQYLVLDNCIVFLNFNHKIKKIKKVYVELVYFLLIHHLNKNYVLDQTMFKSNTLINFLINRYIGTL